MKVKRLALVWIAFALIILSLSACTTATSSTAATTAKPAGTTAATNAATTAAATTAAPAVNYPLTGSNLKLTYWIPLRQAAYEDNLAKNICWQAIQKNTGVTIEFIHPSPEQVTEQLTLLIAGGNLPDLIQIDNRYDANGGAAGGVAEGIFTDLTKYLDKNAPDYMKAVYANDLCWRMLTDESGKIFYFAQIKADAPEYQRFELRKDIQAQIGWGEKIPVTIDDYTQLFADMKKAGLYGTGLVSNGRLDQFMWAYGVANGFYLKDGKVAYGLIEDGYKQYLLKMNEWYKAGYVHPDFTGTLDQEALFTGKSIGLRYGSTDTATSNAAKNNYELLICNYPRLKAGDKMTFQVVTKENKPADGIRTVVSTKCKNIELACQFLNYGYTKKGADIFNYGIEGVSYTVDASGKKTFNYDLFMKNPNGWTTSVCAYVYKLHFGPKLAEPDVVCNPSSVLNPAAVKNRSAYADDTTVSGTSQIRAQLSAKQTSDRAAVMKDIDTYAAEKCLQFIMGKQDINKTWDEYVKTIKGMGIDNAIKITQDAETKYSAKVFPKK